MSNELTRGVVVGLSCLVLGGCSGAAPSVQPPPSLEPSPVSPTSSAPGTDPSADRFVSVVAHARPSSVGVYRSRSAPEPFIRLSNPTEVGAPLVFLVSEESGEWIRVLLPVRPNGSQGWLRTADVELLEHRFQVEVDLGAHRITVTEGATTILEAPVGIGTQDTPTPGGLFYIKELLQPPDPDTIYGPYAYGLSGFSNQLTSFAGGEGVIGIHGTNAPWTVGQNLSHGCIRMHNRDIKKLVPLLPLGTPVKIVA